MAEKPTTVVLGEWVPPSPPSTFPGAPGGINQLQLQSPRVHTGCLLPRPSTWYLRRPS